MWWWRWSSSWTRTDSSRDLKSWHLASFLRTWGHKNQQKSDKDENRGKGVGTGPAEQSVRGEEKTEAV